MAESMARRILHVDMDAFYASVEQQDRPELVGKPVIVGGAQRGVVSAASYEARKFGVRSGMPVFQARQRCPQGIFLPVRMRRYQELSRQVMAVLSEFSPVLEQVSIDEAYLEITGSESLHGPPEMIARKIKDGILAATGLSCSVGIAPNRFLAKIASEMHKPDGLTIIPEHQIIALLSDLPIQKIPGIGEKLAGELKALGVTVVSDILRFTLEFWVKRLGKSGAEIYERAQGRGSDQVVPHREPKSFGAEDTFPQDSEDPEELSHWLLHQAETVGGELRRKGCRARTITLKIKYSDFRVKTRSRTLADPTCSTRVIYDCALQLLGELKPAGKVRLTGISVSNLARGPQQTKLFVELETKKQEELDAAVDRIQNRFGKKAIQRGRQVGFEP
jgi:DNA polymerase-4